MASIQEIAEMKAHEWGFPFDHMLIERLKKVVIPMWATIVQRRYDQTRRFPTALLMTLTCQELVYDDCVGPGIKRSKLKIPKPLVTRDKSDFLFVGERFGFKPFTKKTLGDINLQQYTRFTSKDPYYIYLPDYLYFGNIPHIKQFTVSYVPDNPIELMKLGHVEGDCINDGEFNIIDESLLQGVMSLIEELRPKMLTPHLDAEVDVNEVIP